MQNASGCAQKPKCSLLFLVLSLPLGSLYLLDLLAFRFLGLFFWKCSLSMKTLKLYETDRIQANYLN